MNKLLVLMICIGFTSCNTNAEPIPASEQKISGNLHIEDIRGHTYVIYRGFNKGGLVHDAACKGVHGE